MNNIKGTFELVGGTSQGLSTSDVVVIVVVVLSLICVWASSFISVRMYLI